MAKTSPAVRERAAPPPSDCQPDSLPTVLDLVFTSLRGRALPGSLARQNGEGEPERQLPTMAGFDCRAATLRDKRQGRERHPVNGNDVSGAASAPGASSVDGDIWQSPSRPALHRLASIGRRLFARIAASLERWRERSRGRQHLRALSDHMLKDLGLLRADVENETANTFWRD